MPSAIPAHQRQCATYAIPSSTTPTLLSVATHAFSAVYSATTNFQHAQHVGQLQSNHHGRRPTTSGIVVHPGVLAAQPADDVVRYDHGERPQHGDADRFCRLHH